MPSKSAATLHVNDSMDDDGLTPIVVADDKDMSKPENSDETKLSNHSFNLKKESTHILFPELLMHEWTSPIYVFFCETPRIEYFNSRRAHVFECVAGRCKA